jgi:hypothetical protein
MNFTAISLCVDSQRVFIVVVYYNIDSVRKLLDTPSCMKNLRFRKATCSFNRNFLLEIKIRLGYGLDDRGSIVFDSRRGLGQI